MKLWGRSKFLSLLFLKNNQPKLILRPKRHILGWQILLPYSIVGDLEVVTHTTMNGQRLHSITLQIPHALVKERDAKIPFPDGHMNTLNRVCHLPRDNLNLLGR